MTFRILFAAALAAAAAAPALAQPPERHDPFAMLDANGDGQVTLAEFRAHAAEMFRHVDADGDGRATLDDFRAAHEKMRGEHGGMHPGMRGGRGAPPPGPHPGPPPPERLDGDHDGVVTVAEFSAGLEAHFAVADANHDGAVTREEMQAAHAGMHPRP